MSDAPTYNEPAILRFRGPASMIREVAEDLRDIGRAHRVLGNDHLGERMHGLASELHRAADEVIRLQEDVLTSGLRESQQSAANILNAALAGVKLGAAQ